MQAVVCHDFGQSTVEDIPRPEPAANEVLLEIDRVQLSVTECNLYRGNEITHYEVIRDRLEAGDCRMFGHEFCGTVLEAGDATDSFDPGDRVYAPGKLPCAECQQCRRGFEELCPNKTYIGYDTPGALAEYAVFPREVLCTVPEGVTDAETAAMQPLASSVLCIDEAPIRTGDVVAVFGTGVMGYQSAQLAAIQGASEVIVIDVDSEKLRIARDRGLTAIDATDTDPVERIHKLTNGIGADVVVEAVGGHQRHATDGDDPLAQAVGSVRAGGTIVQVGYIIGDIELTPRAIRKKSVNWINPVSGVAARTPNTSTGEYAARLVARGDISIEEYVTHELDGLDSFTRAVEITMNKPEYGARGPAQIVL